MNPSPAAGAAHRARILVVEPDQTTSASLGDWLGRCGCAVVHASSHAAAAREISRARFDLVFCDPGDHARNPRQWLESLHPQPDCPLVLVSRHQRIDVAIRAANLPIVGSLAKPIDPAALAAIFERTLGLSGASPHRRTAVA